MNKDDRPDNHGALKAGEREFGQQSRFVSDYQRKSELVQTLAYFCSYNFTIAQAEAPLIWSALERKPPQSEEGRREQLEKLLAHFAKPPDAGFLVKADPERLKAIVDAVIKVLGPLPAPQAEQRPKPSPSFDLAP